MNLSVTNERRGVEALEQILHLRTSIHELGSMIVHLMPHGCVIFMADGRCVLGGVAAEYLSLED